MNRGRLVVISGPSGVGKTTLYKRLLSDFCTDLLFSVSATTRAPRTGETDGRDYFFLTTEEFQRRIERSDFVEWAQVYDNYYGTLKSELERIVSTGKTCLLDVDVQGGMNIKKAFPEAVLIFIIPPSIDELKRRITNRRTDTPEVIRKRIAHALHELEYADRYDIQVLNDDIERAYGELKGIFSGLLRDPRECR